ncbi:MAG: zinc ribbon domain-containing protein [Oscillospiraceae bacterium]|jgi:hypothetical protein|nr:zinc ribbon domain-containing protein [Oscillospiraceae bacterium]
MYNNIGKKIKGLAVFFAWLGMIGSIIYGIIMLMQGVNYGSDAMSGLGLLLMVAGSVISWLSSWVLYGFGELIENTAKIAAQRQTVSDAAAPAALKLLCANCGAELPDDTAFCISCGQRVE